MTKIGLQHTCPALSSAGYITRGSGTHLSLRKVISARVRSHRVEAASHCRLHPNHADRARTSRPMENGREVYAASTGRHWRLIARLLAVDLFRSHCLESKCRDCCSATPRRTSQGIAPSFNGRTADSGSAYRGSNPWGATNSLHNRNPSSSRFSPFRFPPSTLYTQVFCVL
jgi:hypothetical protein